MRNWCTDTHPSTAHISQQHKLGGVNSLSFHSWVEFGPGYNFFLFHRAKCSVCTELTSPIEIKIILAVHLAHTMVAVEEDVRDAHFEYTKVHYVSVASVTMRPIIAKWNEIPSFLCIHFTDPHIHSQTDTSARWANIYRRSHLDSAKEPPNHERFRWVAATRMIGATM